MFDASHDAGCRETSLGRRKRPSRKGTTPQHTLNPLCIEKASESQTQTAISCQSGCMFHDI